MLNPRDLRLYLCTDRILSLGRPITETVEAAIAGGITMVQLREKEASSREFYEIALKIKAITQKHGVPLVINDRPDIALAVGAEGIHIGQSDLPLPVVRKLAGKALFIGVSAGNLEEALAAQREGADYVGVGAVYPTGSKADAGEAIGPAGLLAVRRAVSLPVVGIGGIGPQNAGEVKKTGVAGIAVISAILSQPDITEAARALGRAWE
jgi:thiamine-phosphate pyrophosphorylase